MGAVSLKSRHTGAPFFASHSMAKPPPPRPLDTGCTTPIARVAAMAASKALPPFFSTSSAMVVAAGCSVATANRSSTGVGSTSTDAAAEAVALALALACGAGLGGGGSPQPKGPATKSPSPQAIGRA
jgi:hypothetical protein